MTQILFFAQKPAGHFSLVCFCLQLCTIIFSSRPNRFALKYSSEDLYDKQKYGGLELIWKTPFLVSINTIFLSRLSEKSVFCLFDGIWFSTSTVAKNCKYFNNLSFSSKFDHFLLEKFSM